FYAIKKLNFLTNEDKAKALLEFHNMQEIGSFNLSNVIKMSFCYIEGEYIHLVLECGRFSLSDIIKKASYKFSEL
ncbi:MAG: hypothetical protein AAB968_02370, partial [Patescibacteria group bacterium]